MNKENFPDVRRIGDWVVRVRQPLTTGPHPTFLLLHGLTGDENVMWIFAARLPENSYLIAPRGLYQTSSAGYGWYAGRVERWPSVQDFQGAAEALSQLLTSKNFPGADLAKIHGVGFSQGAAMLYTFALLYPARIDSLAGLSGFVPNGTIDLIQNKPLLGKNIFIAHGAQDELVPVERARQSVEILEHAGAQVQYCEDEVGHKLSAACFRGMEAFFQELK